MGKKNHACIFEHVCTAAIKPEIVEVLEKQRDEELAERREKRKKAAEEEVARKAEEEAKKNSEQKMEVGSNRRNIQNRKCRLVVTVELGLCLSSGVIEKSREDVL